MPQHNIVNNVKLFSHELVSEQQYVHKQETIETTTTGKILWTIYDYFSTYKQLKAYHIIG